MNTVFGRKELICSLSRLIFCPVAKAVISQGNPVSFNSFITSSVCSPIDPVEPTRPIRVAVVVISILLTLYIYEISR